MLRNRIHTFKNIDSNLFEVVPAHRSPLVGSCNLSRRPFSTYLTRIECGPSRSCDPMGSCYLSHWEQVFNIHRLPPEIYRKSPIVVLCGYCNLKRFSFQVDTMISI